MLSAAAVFTAAVWASRAVWLPYLAPDPQVLIEKHFASGGAFVDRNGVPLRFFPNDQGDFYHSLELPEFSQLVVDAVITAEDRAFYSHPGFDLKAIARALWQNLSSGRIISGASTISQQVIRITRPAPRTIKTKISELLMALRLELAYSKEEIIQTYLNSVPMFGNLRGISLAGQLLFGKGASQLNLAEAATLAAILQAPARLNPFNLQGNRRLTRRRNWILQEMLEHGLCTTDEYENAIAIHVPTWRRGQALRAPHFCEMLIAEGLKPAGTVTTTIDTRLQDFLTETISSHMARLRRSGASQVSAIIADSRNLEILALAGSAEYGPIAGGFNNGTVARRSGGSVLKPFLYALALEQGYHPSFVVPDTMRTFKTLQGEYLPYNANRRIYGPVTIRTALGNSLNISAVKMLNLLGIKSFYDFLVKLQILENASGAADHLGLGLAIGNSEIRLIDMVKSYATLVNQGQLKSIKYFPGQTQSSAYMMAPATAWLIYDILSDPKSRLLTFGNPSFFHFNGPVALKTGTSTNYRDCWLVAVTPDFVVAIWAGNFSGAFTRNLSGTTAGGPILKDIMTRLESLRPPATLPVPENIKEVRVCSTSGQAPGEFCPLTGLDYLNTQTMALSSCEFHRQSDGVHLLKPEYAAWLQQRHAHIDSDRFQLENRATISDYYSLQGLEQPSSALPAIASGPIKVGPMPAAGSFESIKIVSPHDGDRFVMSAGFDNYARLRAIPESTVSEIIWLINGREYIRTPPPYEAYWPLRPGVHRINAITSSQSGAEITIKVD